MNEADRIAVHWAATARCPREGVLADVQTRRSLCGPAGSYRMRVADRGGRASHEDLQCQDFVRVYRVAAGVDVEAERCGFAQVANLGLSRCSEWSAPECSVHA